MTPTIGTIEVLDEGTPLRFSFEEMMCYAGPGSPGGVAVAYQAMRRAFPLLDTTQPLDRRQITIETAFRGPGARDGFELVTRGLTEGRYVVTATLERPERGKTLEQFVFRFRYRDRTCTLAVRHGLVTDEFITLARTDNRTPDEERHLTELKQELSDRLLAHGPEDVFDVDPA